MTRTMNLLNCKFAKSICIGFSLFALLLLVAAPALMAQTGGTGSIEGTVTDPTGAVVAGASVTATNTSTGVNTTATATGSGRFVISLLQPGTYIACAVTGTHIPLDALRYWSVDLQEAYATPAIATKRLQEKGFVPQ